MAAECRPPPCSGTKVMQTFKCMCACVCVCWCKRWDVQELNCPNLSHFNVVQEQNDSILYYENVSFANITFTGGPKLSKLVYNLLWSHPTAVILPNCPHTPPLLLMCFIRHLIWFQISFKICTCKGMCVKYFIYVYVFSIYAKFHIYIIYIILQLQHLVMLSA